MGRKKERGKLRGAEKEGVKFLAAVRDAEKFLAGVSSAYADIRDNIHLDFQAKKRHVVLATQKALQQLYRSAKIEILRPLRLLGSSFAFRESERSRFDLHLESMFPIHLDKEAASSRFEHISNQLFEMLSDVQNLTPVALRSEEDLDNESKDFFGSLTEDESTTVARMMDAGSLDFKYGSTTSNHVTNELNVHLRGFEPSRGKAVIGSVKLRGIERTETKLARRRCAHCGRYGSILEPAYLVCARCCSPRGCGVARTHYCSVTCQAAAWPSHRSQWCGEALRRVEAKRADNWGVCDGLDWGVCDE